MQHQIPVTVVWSNVILEDQVVKLSEPSTCNAQLSLSFCSDVMWLQHWPSAKPVPCSEHICSVLLSVLPYLLLQHFRYATLWLTYIKMFTSWPNIKGFSLRDALGGGTRVGELAFTCSQRRSLKTLCKWSAALSRGLERLVAARIIQKSTVLLNLKVYQPVHRNPSLVRIIRAVHSEPNLAFLRSVLILSNSPFIFSNVIDMYAFTFSNMRAAWAVNLAVH
jgi:hypothetical protein